MVEGYKYFVLRDYRQTMRWWFPEEIILFCGRTADGIADDTDDDDSEWEEEVWIILFYYLFFHYEGVKIWNDCIFIFPRHSQKLFQLKIKLNQKIAKDFS